MSCSGFANFAVFGILCWLFGVDIIVWNQDDDYPNLAVKGYKWQSIMGER